jgi:hypothetical protein
MASSTTGVVSVERVRLDGVSGQVGEERVAPPRREQRRLGPSATRVRRTISRRPSLLRRRFPSMHTPKPSPHAQRSGSRPRCTAGTQYPLTRCAPPMLARPSLRALSDWGDATSAAYTAHRWKLCVAEGARESRACLP